MVIIAGVVFAAGLVVGVNGWRRRKRMSLVIGGILVLGVAGAAGYEWMIEAAMEWNPSITSDAPVIGTWSDGRETITLRRDHTLDYRSDTEGFTGTWSRDDWNLYITAPEVKTTMRFIRFRDELRLMSRPPVDGDDWDGDTGLTLDRRGK
jgi:hypothetical protein